MKGFMWIAACGAAALVGGTVRQAPVIMDAFDEVRSEITIENDGDTIRIGGRDRRDSAFDRAQAEIDAALAGERAGSDAASSQLEAIEAASAALSQADAEVLAIADNEELSADERASQLSAALAKREEAVSRLESLTEENADAAPGEQVSADVAGALSELARVAEEAGDDVSDEEREEIRAAAQDLRDEIRDTVRDAVRN